eukprot:TRINITY_DN14241_c0_g1_i2.p1 TRINITY_DN14241_c0_g1~~TRINITY_DN14241_c0_g1_i2.p1  ORF type:complete len:350 (-),score=67.86 TRINITY_DN14241_c0_g1_i2:289-1338(-)
MCKTHYCLLKVRSLFFKCVQYNMARTRYNIFRKRVRPVIKEFRRGFKKSSDKPVKYSYHSLVAYLWKKHYKHYNGDLDDVTDKKILSQLRRGTKHKSKPKSKNSDNTESDKTESNGISEHERTTLLDRIKRLSEARFKKEEQDKKDQEKRLSHAALRAENETHYTGGQQLYVQQDENIQTGDVNDISEDEDDGTIFTDDKVPASEAGTMGPVVRRLNLRPQVRKSTASAIKKLKLKKPLPKQDEDTVFIRKSVSAAARKQQNTKENKLKEMKASRKSVKCKECEKEFAGFPTAANWAKHCRGKRHRDSIIESEMEYGGDYENADDIPKSDIDESVQISINDFPDGLEYV